MSSCSQNWYFSCFLHNRLCQGSGARLRRRTIHSAQVAGATDGALRLLRTFFDLLEAEVSISRILVLFSRQAKMVRCAADGGEPVTLTDSNASPRNAGLSNPPCLSAERIRRAQTEAPRRDAKSQPSLSRECRAKERRTSRPRALRASCVLCRLSTDAISCAPGLLLPAAAPTAQRARTPCALLLLLALQGPRADEHRRRTWPARRRPPRRDPRPRRRRRRRRHARPPRTHASMLSGIITAFAPTVSSTGRFWQSWIPARTCDDIPPTDTRTRPRTRTGDGRERGHTRRSASRPAAPRRNNQPANASPRGECCPAAAPAAARPNGRTPPDTLAPRRRSPTRTRARPRRRAAPRTAPR